MVRTATRTAALRPLRPPAVAVPVAVAVRVVVGSKGARARQVARELALQEPRGAARAAAAELTMSQAQVPVVSR